MQLLIMSLNVLNTLYFTRRSISLRIIPNQPITVHWYGVGYLISYLLVTKMLRDEIKQEHIPISMAQISKLSDITLLGGLIGGRFWYLVLRYIETGEPIWHNAFHVWEGGMAFQGGIVGAFLAGYLCLSFMNKRSYFASIVDIVSTKIPLSIMIGRIGNFLNEEFMSPVFGMPSCIFSSLTEGFLAFILLNYAFDFKKYKYGRTSAFLVLYAVLRFINDIFREEEVYRFAFLNLRASQYVCLGILACGLLLGFKGIRSRRLTRT